MLYCDFDVIDTVIKMCVKKGGQYHDSITSLKFPLLGDSRVWLDSCVFNVEYFFGKSQVRFLRCVSGMGFSLRFPRKILWFICVMRIK